MEVIFLIVNLICCQWLVASLIAYIAFAFWLLAKLRDYVADLIKENTMLYEQIMKRGLSDSLTMLTENDRRTNNKI
jgi:hypothetical protein